MRKVGRILFCFVPFLLAFGIQTLLSVPFMGVSFAYILCTSGQTAEIDTLLNDLQAVWTSSTFTIWLSLTYGIIALIVFFIWYQKRFAGLHVKGLTRQFNLPIILSLICIVVGLQHVITYLVSLVAAIQPLWLEHYETLIESVGFADVTLPLVIYSVIVGPICEELIFRGVTFGYAKREMPFWIANVLQAFIFGVFHMNMIQGIYAFFIGLFFGYICHKSSIYAAILLHMLFNFWATFIQNRHMSNIDTPFFFFLWLAVGIVFTCAGILIFRKGIQKMENSTKDFVISSDI